MGACGLNWQNMTEQLNQCRNFQLNNFLLALEASFTEPDLAIQVLHVLPFVEVSGQIQQLLKTNAQDLCFRVKTQVKTIIYGLCTFLCTRVSKLLESYHAISICTDFTCKRGRRLMPHPCFVAIHQERLSSSAYCNQVSTIRYIAGAIILGQIGNKSLVTCKCAASPWKNLEDFSCGQDWKDWFQRMCR